MFILSLKGHIYPLPKPLYSWGPNKKVVIKMPVAIILKFFIRHPLFPMDLDESRKANHF